MKPKTWRFYPEDPHRISQLASELNILDIVSRILINRGIDNPEDAEKFLRPQLTDLTDPFLLSGMKEATERVLKALNQREKILIYGDFDADGVTSTTLLLQFFKLLGTSVRYYIPNRISEGYSFTPQGIQAIQDQQIDLVISVDNGINSYDEIAYLKKHGIDVIITDHHEPPDQLPPAYAIINPKCAHCKYPFKQLSGVGVAFKFTWGMAQHFSKSKKVSPEFRQFLLNALAWVAIGTIADLVPLKGENRLLAKYGLPAIQDSKNPGLRALCDTTNISHELTSEDISFRIGPRINAAGRMGQVEVAVDLFLTQSYEEALHLATRLDELNKQRQTIEKEIFDEVSDRTHEMDDEILIMGDKKWHPGVIGVVASKLVEEHGKPVVLISFVNEKGRGSCRSVPGFDVYHALCHCADLLDTFGGHSSAGGLQIDRSNVEAFRTKIIRFLQSSTGGKKFEAFLRIDCEIQLTALSHGLLSQLDKLRPFGENNPVPVFVATNLALAQPAQQVGRDSTHLSFVTRQGNKTFKAIAFKRGDEMERLNGATTFSLAFTPKMNVYNGRSNIELDVKDILFE
jgi:single-stranded-DNA-specific exonuclease